MLRSVVLCLALVLATAAAQAPPPRKLAISYAPGGLNWPLFIAKEGHYYEKHGLDVDLVLSPNTLGAAMLVSGQSQLLNYSLDQMMNLATKDSSVVFISSPTNRAMFALLARSDIPNIARLKGKRLAIGQLGDASYGYTATLLSKSGISKRDVTWVPFGPDPATRLAGVLAGSADAALVTASAYLKAGSPRLRVLNGFGERNDIFAAAVVVVNRATLTRHPDLPTQVIKAHTEATKRFYEDPAFAIEAFTRYEKLSTPADASWMYDLYSKANAFERIPYVLADAVESTIGQQPDPRTAKEFMTFDFRKVVDNSFVSRLVAQGFFREVFGPSIEAEERQKIRAAFGESTRK